MPNPFTLQPVIDLARNDADRAAVRLGHAMQKLIDADQQLQTLLAYREEYQAKFRDSVTSGIDSTGWQNFHLFLAKLESGIETARARADVARAAAKGAQDEWQMHQRKVKAYDVLAQRHERAEAVRDARREQRESDDRISGTFARNPSTQRLR